ncbi:MAG TPA: FG-GAP repeat protein [Candidatus Binatia bacterium]|nr:FG-GAP repeat protein [Candidatus Binatia bacterium]
MKDDASIGGRSRRAFGTPLALVFATLFLWVLDYDGAAYASGTDLLVEQQQLSAGDKTVGGQEQFGSSVAIDGDTAVVGAPGSGTGGTATGAAYVFTRDSAGGQWTQKQKLTPSDGATGKFFGSSVALSGGTAFVGARGDSSRGNFAGAVYVFVRDTSGQTWSQAQKLTADGGVGGDLFGCSVALLGDTALIGARGSENNSAPPGAAYIFTRGTDGQWHQLQKLTASDGTAGDGFGFSVALSDNTAVIGARRGVNDTGSISGAAYIFTPDVSGQWNQWQKLTASDGANGDEFGYSVATSEDTVLVGARFAQGVGNPTSTLAAGAVYDFVLGAGPIGTIWEEVQKLVASDGAARDEFGFSVALNGDTALVGAPQNNTGGGATGAAYLFALLSNTQGTSQLTERQKLSARDAAALDAFGSSVVFNGDTALVGAPLDGITVTDDKGNSTTYVGTGSVTTFVQTSLPGTCTPKTDYDAVGCSGTFSVSSLTDLDQYVADDFGRKGKSQYQNLEISGSLTYPVLNIESPCTITFKNGITLSGDFVNIDGRKGVVGTGGFQNIDATTAACVVSEQNGAELGAYSTVRAGALTLQAAQAAKIGGNTSIIIDRDLVITSTGDSSSSTALIDSGAVVTAGSIKLQAPLTAQLGQDTIVTADGLISLVSTGTSSSSQAGMQPGAQVKATDLNISSPQKAIIGQQTTVLLSGNLTLTSTGTGSGSQAVIDAGANVTVDGNANIEAANCKISSSAVINAGTKSGNCL